MGPGGAALVRRRGAGQRVDFPGLPRRFVDLPRGGCRRSPQFGAGGRFPGLPRRFVDLPRGGCRRSPQFGAEGRFPGVAPAIRRFAPRRVPAESPVRSRRPFSRGCPGDSSICPADIGPNALYRKVCPIQAGKLDGIDWWGKSVQTTSEIFRSPQLRFPCSPYFARKFVMALR